MAIQSVAVEENGWVLAVRGAWGATTGTWEYSGNDRVNGRFVDGETDQFPLDPDGAARVRLLVARHGFTRTESGVAPSAGDTEALVATKALRRPYPNQAELDEVVHEDGTRTVRLALSDRLYEGDAVVQATFLAGWKAGEGAASLTTGGVANDSHYPQPLAISRWAQPHYSLLRGASRLEVDLIVAAHHPRHFGATTNQALAALKLTATDGTQSKDFWFFADRVSSQYGDGLRCWGGEIDLAGLTPGPISIHHTTYPWIGAERSTGSAHLVDQENGVPVAWATPLVVCYDPDGTLYPSVHVFVDAASGVTTAANVTVGSSAAAAKAGTAAADISTAVQALYLANLLLPARNGWPAATRIVDWATITLAAGVQSWGATTVTYGASTGDGRLIIRGDPDDSDPRAHCIWRSGSATPVKRINRFWLADLTLEAGEATFGAGFVHYDNVEVRGKPGRETDTLPLFYGTPPGGRATLSATRLLWWKYGTGFRYGASTKCLLQRNCSVTRGTNSVVFINCSKPPDPGDPNRTLEAFTLSASGETDGMVWQCRADDWAGKFISLGEIHAHGDTTTPLDPATITRFAMVNSLCERSRGASTTRIWALGESANEQMQDSVWEGNTLVGNGVNGFYNAVPGANAANLAHTGNHMRNNVFGWHATKHDIFRTDGSRIGSWEYLFGAGLDSNVHGNRSLAGTTNFQFAWFGLNAAYDIDYAEIFEHDFLKFVDDRSDALGVPGVGGGDYHPAAGSPMLGRATVASAGQDIEGTPRGAVFSAGAFESAVAPELHLRSADARHALSSSATALRQGLALRPASAAHESRAQATAVRPSAPPETPGANWWRGRTIQVEGDDDRTLRAGRD